MDAVPWRISGSYLEACNCEAIAPAGGSAGVPVGGQRTESASARSSWIVERDGRATLTSRT